VILSRGLVVELLGVVSSYILYWISGHGIERLVENLASSVTNGDLGEYRSKVKSP
jgi:hypothetical protein